MQRDKAKVVKGKLLSIRTVKRDGPFFSEVRRYSPADIRELRERFNISQAVLAQALNTGVGAVQHWETGIRQPSGPALKLLEILDRKGLDALL